jgi:hypothetical protein
VRLRLFEATAAMWPHYRTATDVRGSRQEKAFS